MGKFLDRIARLVTRAEGEVGPGPYQLPVTGGWLPAGTAMNWWQLGFDVQRGSGRSALVEACVSAYSQTVAMCPGDHWWLNPDTHGRERITTSALCRVLKRPNAYSSISDFLLNLVRDLYMDGNAYALALRNDRYEISELHLMNPRQSMPQIAVTGEVFYALGGNPVIDRQLSHPLLVPQRDVLHVRLQTSQYSLRGESPIESVANEIAASDAILQQQVSFYLNQARPSTVLTTDLNLDKAQLDIVRQLWNEQSRGLNAGGTPILTAGLKPVSLSTTPKDAELSDILKMTREDIALAFRVPLQVLGIGGAPFGSTELLMQGWIATGLGFCLNHVEEAFGRLFNLKGQPDEYVEFSTDSLLRSAMKDRIESLARGVQGGIFSPNEARESEGYPQVKFGDEPRVQQQVVPLSAAAGIPAAPAPGAAPAAPPAPAPPTPPTKELTDAIARDLIAASREFDVGRPAS